MSLIRHLGGLGNWDGSAVPLRTLLRGDSGFKVISRSSEDSRWSDDEKVKLRRLNGASIFSSDIRIYLVKKSEIEILKSNQHFETVLKEQSSTIEN